MQPTEFLRTTYIISDDLPIFIAGGIGVLALLVFFLVVATKRTKGKGKGRSFEWSIAVALVALMGMAVTAAFTSAYNTGVREANLTANIKSVYSVDSLEYGKMVAGKETRDSADDKQDVTVIHGDKVYRGFVTQNVDTFEPTLNSYENESDITELKR